MKKSNQSFLSNKVVLILAVIISLSCADYFYDELYSAFYPEVAKVPAKSERFFFTNFYPYGIQAYEYDTNAGNDSINTDSWVKYTGNVFSRNTIYQGLYRNDERFIQTLKQKGFKEASEYVNLLTKTDKIILSKSNANYWEQPLPKDTITIISFYPKIEQSIKNCSEIFLKERYIYLLLKTTMSVADHKSTVSFYEKYSTLIQNKTFISEWSRCKYAGALYHTNEHVRSFYEFSQLFHQSPTTRAEAGNSVIVYNIPSSEQALQLCKNEQEKANVYALAAILPKGDGSGMMKKVYQLNPNHEMLQLIATREINKIEELYFNVKMNGDDEYNAPLNSLEKSSTEDLLSFINNVITDKKTENPGFWKLAGAYLYFMKGEHEKGKNYLAEINDDPSNPYIAKQRKLLGIFFELQGNAAYDESSFANIYKDVSSLMSFRDTRDMSSMKLISRLLTEYFNRNSNIHPPTRPSSFFSGCGKKDKFEPFADTFGLARVFFARSLSNLSGTYEEDGTSYYLGGFERQLFLDTLSTTLLSTVVNFIEQKNMRDIDTMLIHISKVTDNEIYLAHGRRLMLEHRFEEALATYSKINAKYMQGIIEYVDFRNGPELYLKTQQYKTVKDYPGYIAEIIKYKNETIAHPENAEAWYRLGEALINISYHGKAWILSKSIRSSGEKEYYWWLSDKVGVKPAEKENDNYYGNEAALACFEKAAKYCKDKNLGARISYLGAVAEKSKFWHQYYKNQPEDYEKQEAYHQSQMVAFNGQYRTFFQLLKSKFYGSDYEKMILRECDEYRQFAESQ